MEGVERTNNNNSLTKHQQVNSNQNQNSKQGTKPSPSASPSASPGDTKLGSPAPGRLDRNELQLEVEASLAQAKTATESLVTADVKELVKLEKRVEEFNKRSERQDISDQDLQSEADALITDAGRLRDASAPTLLSRLFGATVVDLTARLVALVGFVLIGATLILLLRMHGELARLHSAVKTTVTKEDLFASKGSLRTLVLSGFEHELATASKIDEQITEFRDLKERVIIALDQLGNSAPKPSGQPQDAAVDDPVTDSVYVIPENLFLGELLQSIDENQKIPVSYQIANSVFVPADSGKLIVITNNHNSDMAILVPKATRLNSLEQFSTYFQEAYDCHNVTVGSVFILNPTTVRKVGNGWEIETRGSFDIRGD